MDDETIDSRLASALVPFKHRERACAACHYAVKEEQDLVCRRMPPQVGFLSVPGQVMTPKGMQAVMKLQTFTQFPVMRDDAWCGEFRDRTAHS
jgi:hypothetical protein